MEKISAETIGTVSKQMNKITKEQAVELIHKMKEEQPAVLEYLMSAGCDIFDDSEKEWFLYLGVTLWQAAVRANPSLPILRKEIFDKNANSAAGMISYLRGEPETELQTTITSIFGNYAQPELLKFIISAIGVAQRDRKCVRKENVTMIFFFLKILIDCFEEASRPEAEK